MIFYSCLNCKNYIGKVEDIHKPTCTAFLKGIPKEILTGENNHTKPLPKQGNDIVFEPIDKKP